MPNFSEFGDISALEAYSLDKLGAIFNHDKDWARDTFVRPIDRKTKVRKLDQRTGKPLPGVRHFRAGWEIIITGAALIRWLEEHGDQIEDDDE